MRGCDFVRIEGLTLMMMMAMVVTVAAAMAKHASGL